MLLLAATAASAETRVVQVSASVAGTGRTPEQARREALDRARDEALSRTASIRVAAQQLRLRGEQADGTLRDGFSSLVQTSTEGRIVEETVTYTTRLENDVPVYDATLLAVVELEDGAPDPGFTIELAADPASRTLRDGEELAVEVTASRRCYLTLIQIGAGGRPVLLVPNGFMTETVLEAGRSLRIPAKTAGFRFRARLPDGTEDDREQLLAIGTLDPVTFTIDPGEDGFTALNRWLLRIPAARRAEALRDYQIGK
jgi:hypothetical protein